MLIVTDSNCFNIIIQIQKLSSSKRRLILKLGKYWKRPDLSICSNVYIGIIRLIIWKNTDNYKRMIVVL